MPQRARARAIAAFFARVAAKHGFLSAEALLAVQLRLAQRESDYDSFVQTEDEALEMLGRARSYLRKERAKTPAKSLKK